MNHRASATGVSIVPMMDKLDLRLNTLMPFKDEFHQFLEEVKHHPRDYGFHQSEHYAVVGSLSPFGIDGQFHGWLRHRRDDKLQTHKVELNDVGLTGKSRVFADLERLVDCDPKRLEIMRIDLAADVPDVPVTFFKQHMRVALKRRGAHVTQFEHIYQGEGDTIYFGKRPNCYRVYNKIAELKHQHKRSLLRGMAAERREHARAIANVSRDNEIPQFIPAQWPTFEEAFSRKGTECLTRVERQITGRLIPPSIARIGQLDHLPDFNPYVPLEFLFSEAPLPKPHDSRFNFTQYHCGLFLRELQQQESLDYVKTYIRNWVGNKVGEVYELYKPFLEPLSTPQKVSGAEIFEIYRDSVKRQLAA